MLVQRSRGNPSTSPTTEGSGPLITQVASTNRNVTISTLLEKPEEWPPFSPHQLPHARERKTGEFQTKTFKISDGVLSLMMRDTSRSEGKQIQFIGMLESDPDHRSFHQSAEYHTVVKSKACEEREKRGLELSAESSVAPTSGLWWWWTFPRVPGFGENARHFIPRLRFFCCCCCFFNSRTLIPLFRPGSVHSGSAS